MKFEIVDNRLKLTPETPIDCYKCGVVFANVGVGTILYEHNEFQGLMVDLDKVLYQLMEG